MCDGKNDDNNNNNFKNDVNNIKNAGNDAKSNVNDDRNDDNDDDDVDGTHGDPSPPSQHALTVIVPFRDRFDELMLFVPNLSTFLRHQNIAFEILVINQVCVGDVLIV